MKATRGRRTAGSAAVVSLTRANRAGSAAVRSSELIRWTAKLTAPPGTRLPVLACTCSDVCLP